MASKRARRKKPVGKSKRARRTGVIETRPPPIEVQQPGIRTLEDGVLWPQDVPMPNEWHKPRRRALPCPNCRRVLTDEKGQAVICMSSGGNGASAWFRCRCCGHRWPLPVREV